MATDAQIAANRENAQHSTGPTSEAGKEAVSHNSTIHGLTGNFIFLCDEDRAEFNKMLRSLLIDLNASTDSEFELVDKMAQSLWRSRRALELQDKCIDILAFEDESLAPATRKNLELYIRYQTSHDRAYQRYAAELRKLQAELKKAEIGFVSQKHAAAQETRRENNEIRRQEQHANTVQLQKARLEHALLRNRKLDCEVSQLESSKMPRSSELLAASLPSNE
jgi:phage-related minor tail protein